MCKPSIYLVVTYFPTYLPIYETYLLQNWLPRWNRILTQLRFIYNWVIMGIQWMVRWWVLVHCGQVNKRSVNINTRYLPSSFWGGWQANLNGRLLQKNETMEPPQNRRFCFDVCSSSTSAQLHRWKENNICQSVHDKNVHDKNEVLIWRTCWGTHCELGEHIGNPLRT